MLNRSNGVDGYQAISSGIHHRLCNGANILSIGRKLYKQGSLALTRCFLDQADILTGNSHVTADGGAIPYRGVWTGKIEFYQIGNRVKGFHQRDEVLNRVC